MLLAIEVKASERSKARLRAGEVINDIRKLAAHREEVKYRGGQMHPVMLVIDTAPEEGERMRPEALSACKKEAATLKTSFLYVSPSADDLLMQAD